MHRKQRTGVVVFTHIRHLFLMFQEKERELKRKQREEEKQEIKRKKVFHIC